MKKALKAILPLIFTLFFVIFLNSCQLTQLPSPENLNADFFELSWDAVENADGYKIIMDGEKEFFTEDTSFSLFEHVAPGELHTFEVISAGKRNKESDAVFIEYTAEEVTPGLHYSVISFDDGSISDYIRVSCPEDAIPENGELVLPDMYEGVYINEFDAYRVTLYSASTSGAYDGIDYSKIKKVRLPSNLTKVYVGALHKSLIEEIYIPDSVTILSGLSECQNLKEITIPKNVEFLYDCAFQNCKSLRKITMEGDLRGIRSYAFYGCEALEEINIQGSLSSIKEYAFYGCKSLREITIPSGITSIIKNAFRGCDALEKITLPDGIEEIASNAFDDTAYYKAQEGEEFIYIDNYLYEYRGKMQENTSIVLPQTTRGIVGVGIFKNQNNLVSITIPDKVEIIASRAFFSCKYLQEVKMSANVKIINAEAFKDCLNLETFSLGEKVEYIGDYAFANCKKITSVSIPDNTQYIGEYAFAGCEALYDVKLGKNITKLGDYAFIQCSSLEKITMPDEIETFHINMFLGTGVTWVNVPKNANSISKITNDSPITAVVIPKEFKEINYNSFFKNKKLSTFFFTGTEEEWEHMSKVERWRNTSGYMLTPEQQDELEAMFAEWMEALTVYFYSEEAPTEEGNFWHYVDGTPTKW